MAKKKSKSKDNKGSTSSSSSLSSSSPTQPQPRASQTNDVVVEDSVKVEGPALNDEVDSEKKASPDEQNSTAQDKEETQSGVKQEEEKKQEIGANEASRSQKQQVETPVSEPTPEPESQLYPTQQQAQEPTPTPAPAPAAQPKKRLTLQERLALAAKSKSGKSKRTTSSGSPATSTATSTSINRVVSSPTPELASISLSPTPRASVEILRDDTKAADLENKKDDGSENKAEQQQEQQTTDYSQLSPEGLVMALKEIEKKFEQLETKNKSLTQEKAALKKLEANGSIDPHILKEKNQTIEQLLKEGEELSKKELRANELIKKLKAKDSDSEYEIRSLTNSIDLLNTEKKQLKDSVRKFQDKESTLSNKVKSLQIQLDNETQSLQDEINRNSILSEKVEILSKELTDQKTKHTKEVKDLNRTLELTKTQITVLNEEHFIEIKRLEDKIEQLRLASETDQTMTSSKSDDSYIKLTRQYDTLQKQYTSATENWQSIEASLMKKVHNLEKQVEEAKLKELTAVNESQLLSQDLKTKTTEFNKLQRTVSTSYNDNETMKIKLDSLAKNFSELEEKYRTDTLRLTQEKNLLESKSQELERKLKSQEQVIPQTITALNTISDLQSPRPFSSHRSSSASSLKFKNWGSASAWESNVKDIGFGESSTTPFTSRKPSSTNISHGTPHNASFDNLSDFEEEFDDNDKVDNDDDVDDTGSRYSASTPILGSFSTKGQSMLNAGSVIGTGIGGISGSSVQMLSKLSNQVRRLEIELSTMKEELEQASQEKKSASEEIVRLMKENEKVESFKAQIAQLTKDVEVFSNKYERSLEILGEKSEQVEELKADIVDLKDLLKAQVQQMIELQEKIKQ